jgi:DNA polymerase III subunit beta
MQFIIERDRFLEVLTKLASIIDSKAAVPIIKNVFIEANGSAIILRTTDCHMQLSMPCPAEVTKPGQITVDCKLLHEMVRLCPKAGQIGLSLGSEGKRRKASADGPDRLYLACGAFKATLMTLPAADFPLMQMAAGAAEFRLECRQLAALIEKTRFAISTDETRYYLGGIYLHCLGEALAAAATDGHRLARKTVPLPAGADDMPEAGSSETAAAGVRVAGDGFTANRGVIIPKYAAFLATKILPDSEVECELAISARMLRLTIGSVELVSKLIDGTYPDYQRVLPGPGVARMVVPREALTKAVSRVGAVLDKRDHVIAMRFYGENLELSAYSHERGHSARELIEDCALEGEEAGVNPETIGVNPHYLSEALEAMNGAQIVMVLQSNPGAPVLFEEVDGDGSLKMIIMPMRLPVAGAMPGEEAKKKAA